jgi:hypothetical protein
MRNIAGRDHAASLRNYFRPSALGANMLIRSNIWWCVCGIRGSIDVVLHDVSLVQSKEAATSQFRGVQTVQLNKLFVVNKSPYIHLCFSISFLS